MTAEQAVATTYAYPNKPERFVEDVHPYLVQLILAEGRRPMVAAVEAVYAVLVRSDERQRGQLSDIEVSTTLEVPMRTFATWKAHIDALRAEAAQAGALLDLADGPGASAPPSPPPSPPSPPPSPATRESKNGGGEPAERNGGGSPAERKRGGGVLQRIKGKVQHAAHELAEGTPNPPYLLPHLPNMFATSAQYLSQISPISPLTRCSTRHTSSPRGSPTSSMRRHS